MANIRNSRVSFRRGLLTFLRYGSYPGVLFLLLIAAERPGRAYTDPGTGGMLVQLLATAVLGACFYVHKAIRWFRVKGKD